MGIRLIYTQIVVYLVGSDKPWNEKCKYIKIKKKKGKKKYSMRCSRRWSYRLYIYTHTNERKKNCTKATTAACVYYYYMSIYFLSWNKMLLDDLMHIQGHPF